MARFSDTSIGRFLAATGDTWGQARKAQALAQVPDAAFEAIGTTRDRELRKLMQTR